MNNTNNFIPEEELPPRSGLRVIRKTNPYFGLSEDEIQDRLEFINCYLLKEFEDLLQIPKMDQSDDFLEFEFPSSSPQYSAFNSVDFQDQRQPFDKYRYAMQKIMDRIRDLAIMHSSISDPDGRVEVITQYENFIDSQFRDRLKVFAVQYNNSYFDEKRSQIKQKIAELNCRILQARKIWERLAPPENWDR